MLKGTLKALAQRSKLSLEFEELDGELPDAVELHLGASLSEEGARRLPKTMALCYRVLSHRTVDVTAVVGSETRVLHFEQGTTPDEFRAAVEPLCEAIVDDRAAS